MKAISLMKYFATFIMMLFFPFNFLSCYLEWNSNKLWVEKMSEYS